MIANTATTTTWLTKLLVEQPSLMSDVRKFAGSFEYQKPPLPSHSIGELSLRIHSVLCDAESRLIASLPEERHHEAQRMRDALEKSILTRLYPIVFAAGDGDLAADEALFANLRRLQPIFTPARLGVAAPFCDAPREAWQPAIDMLCKINYYRAPRDKVVLVVNCCRLIESVLHELLLRQLVRDPSHSVPTHGSVASHSA